MYRLLFKVSTPLIAILIISALFVGSAATSTSAQVITSDNISANTENGLVDAGAQKTDIKHFIFRDDDIVPYSENGITTFSQLNALKAVNQVHIDKSVPVTSGIVTHPDPGVSGNQLLADNDTLSYLRSLAKNPLFEFAQHGYTHHNNAQSGGSATEFSGRYYLDQYNEMKQGRNDITEALGVTPSTFIPPWNSGDRNTLKAATALGFTLYSTGWEDFNVFNATKEGIAVQAVTLCIAGYTTDEWQTHMKKLTRDTDAALDAGHAGQNFVLFYHHWQFLAPDGSVDPVRLSLFEQYIDHLKSRGDVQFTTLNNQNVLPHSAETQLNLTASSAISSVNQPVTLTATLNHLDSRTNQWVAVESGKPIQIWHTDDGVRYNDTTKKTDGGSRITFTASRTTPGVTTYYASFPPDSAYIASTSSPVTITVAPTQLNLTASSAITSVNQPVTLTATLTHLDSSTNQWVAVESGKPIQIWHTDDGVHYNDTIVETDSNGQITYMTNWTTPGYLTYYASYPGDSVYGASYSSPLAIHVSEQIQTALVAWGVLPANN